MLSGTSLGYWAFQTEPRQVAFDIGVAAGIETNDTKILMEKLRQVDFKKLYESQISVIAINLLLLLQNGIPFAPSLEPKHQEGILMDYPYEIMEKGKFNRVPVMMGVTTLEMASLKKFIHSAKPLMVLFNISPGLLVRITKSHRNRTIVGNKIKRFFLNTTDVLAVDEEDILKYIGEDAFYRPMRKAASLLSKHNSVYFYEFSHKGELPIETLKRYTGKKDLIRDFDGVGHAEDLAYMFKAEFVPEEYYEKEMKMIKKMTKIYTNFAKTGNPTPIQDPLLDNLTWPKVAFPDGHIFPVVNLNERRFETVISDNFDQKRIKFWNKVFREYAEKPYIVY